MVAGQSGVGKSTFIDCFLEKVQFYFDKNSKNPMQKYNVQTSIRSRTKEITEKEGWILKLFESHFCIQV